MKLSLACFFQALRDHRHQTIVTDLTFLALAAREDVLASCSLDGTVRLWTLEGWRNLLTLP